MSTKAATEFLEKVADDPALQAQFSASGGEPKEQLAAIVAAGGKRGLTFTEDEAMGVLRTKSKEGVLDERQLAGVAGGVAWYAYFMKKLEGLAGGEWDGDRGDPAGGGVRG